MGFGLPVVVSIISQGYDLGSFLFFEHNVNEQQILIPLFAVL